MDGRSQFIISVLLCLFAYGAKSEMPVSPDGDRVLQFLVAPVNPDQAWMLTRDNLQFNDGLKSGGRWQLKFNRNVFRRVTDRNPNEVYRHRKIQASKSKPGNLYLLVQNGDELFIFRTADYGESWKYAPVSRAQQDAVISKKKEEGGAVDLNDLDMGRPKKSAARESAHQKASNSQPVFKVLFDLLLQNRPGITPLTFDNFHTLLLIDIIPRPEIMFSFEVSPSPRFYEFSYQVNPQFQVRAGKIWIPFDDLNPHNLFGGYINTSRLQAPGASAFLPDLWTDLGVAAKYRLLDGDFIVDSHLYVVNGFQAGGSNPVEASTAYPNFSSTAVPDNNSDKAIGVRLHATYQRMFSAGISAYTGKYTNDGEEGRRITMFGFDSSLRINPFDLRMGYVFMTVALPSTATDPSYSRGGLYAEARYKFTKNWFASVRGGIQQADDRVVDINDQQILGARFGYEADWFNISLQHHKDLKDVDGKVNREFTALRLVLML